MPNNYFRFKQFTIHQDRCAMKVCTDASLFGAWVAGHRSALTTHCLLDIGTGTGLLSLMFAQKNPDVITDAVEIDEAAAEQARENFEASPWKERFHIYHSSIQQFAETINKKYDCIIANPPFFETDLKSDNAKRNLALHSTDLKLEELINIADKLLDDGGSFFVLLPDYRTKHFEALIKGTFFIEEKVLVKQTEKHGWFRGMLWLTKQPATISQSEIVIMGDDEKYTPAFIALLKNFYLYL